jgi:hypothetical protein
MYSTQIQIFSTSKKYIKTTSKHAFVFLTLFERIAISPWPVAIGSGGGGGCGGYKFFLF